MKVAIADSAGAQWVGGQTYASVAGRAMGLLALKADGLEVSMIGRTDKKLPGTEFIPLRGMPRQNRVETLIRRAGGRADRVAPLPGERRLRQNLHLANPMDVLWQARKHGCDAVFPVTVTPPRRSGLGLIAWIPDLQHRTHPEFFLPAAVAGIDGLVRRLADRCDLVVLSSSTLSDEFTSFFPRYAEKVRVLPFPSRFAFEVPVETPDARIYYNLPEDYFLCPNQFWRHKNHMLVIDAMDRLADAGEDCFCVFTGLPVDPRDPANSYLSELLQAVAARGLGNRVRILGQIPRDHLDSLLLSCTAIVQPSLSEGWSTTVQDAKALGVQILALDTLVLREQAPKACFFENDADSLAAAMMNVRPRGEDFQDHLCQERRFARRFAKDLLEIFREAADAV